MSDYRDYEEFGGIPEPLPKCAGEFDITYCKPSPPRSAEKRPGIAFMLRAVKVLPRAVESETTPIINKALTDNEKGWQMALAMLSAFDASSLPEESWRDKGFMDPTGRMAGWCEGFVGKRVYAEIGQEKKQTYDSDGSLHETDDFKNVITGWGRIGGKNHTAFLKRYDKTTS